MSDWREEPATQKQRDFLDKLEVSYPAVMTRGMASDLISKALPAETTQVEKLKFFRIKGAAGYSQFDAIQTLAELFADPSNEKKWENRRCDARQKEILTFFNLPISKGLKHIDADKLINILFKNDAMQDKWQSHADAASERDDWFDYARDDLNDMAADFDCKKLSVSRFKEVVAKLEERGLTLDEIEDEPDTFFEEALVQFPELERF